MKIAIATAVYYPMINGVAVFSHNLALGLAARGHEVLVLTPSQTGRSYTRTADGVKVQYLRSVKVRVYPDQIHDVPPKKKFLGVEWPHLFYRHGFRVSAFPQGEVKKALDTFSPDVVHVQVSDPIGLSAVAYARKKGIPVVTTEHNQPEVLTEPLHVPGVVKKPVDALLAAYLVNRQSKSDFVTMPTKQAILNFLDGRKDFPVPVAAVSNGVDLTAFKPGEPRAALLKKYGLKRGEPVVLYVGRVDPEKNVETLIEAFASAAADVPAARLLIVGDGVDRVRLEKKASKMGLSDRVIFAGRVVPPDLYEVYKLGTVFATASEIETQGIVLIEAAATGLPLIAVKAGAVAEVCQDGVNGFLCQPGDVAEIAAAIVKILSEPELCQQFSKKSIEIAAEHDFNHTLEQFENIYRRVIKSNI